MDVVRGKLRRGDLHNVTLFAKMKGFQRKFANPSDGWHDREVRRRLAVGLNRFAVERAASSLRHIYVRRGNPQLSSIR